LDLSEFVREVCLGVRMQQLGLKRYLEAKDTPGFANQLRNAVEDDAEPVGDEDDDWTSSEEEVPTTGDEVREPAQSVQPTLVPIKPLYTGDFEYPFKLFKPFSQGLN
jgi:hypothetical protein